MDENLTGYMLHFKELESEEDFHRLVLVGENMTEFTLRGLESGTEYVLKLAALNDIGVGPYSSLSKVTTILGE